MGYIINGIYIYIYIYMHNLGQCKLIKEWYIPTINRKASFYIATLSRGNINVICVFHSYHYYIFYTNSPIKCLYAELNVFVYI